MLEQHSLSGGMVRKSTDIRNLVDEYVKALEPLLRVDKVILYGSYANGEPHEWSDIDLAVISRGFANKDRPTRQKILARGKLASPSLLYAMISPLGYSVAEYNNAERQTFLGEIKRTGKVIYTRRKRTPRRSASNGHRVAKTRSHPRKSGR